MPRYAHGSGRLLAGLLVPLAEYGGAGTGFTLAAATPGFALKAGERIVLTLLETGSSGARSGADAGGSAVLQAVHQRCAERYDLRSYRMFWDAACAMGLRELCGDAVGGAAILRLQDEGRAVEAWTAAGFEVTLGSSRTAPEEQRRLARWLSSLPVNLPGLAQRVSDALPAAGEAVIRCGSGALVLSGFNGGTTARRDGPSYGTFPHPRGQLRGSYHFLSLQHGAAVAVIDAPGKLLTPLESASVALCRTRSPRPGLNPWECSENRAS
jgi:hypothetical protein